MSAGDWGLLIAALWLVAMCVLAALCRTAADPVDEHYRSIAAILADGSHDVLPEVDDWWREVAYDYLEQMWALPARERAS